MSALRAQVFLFIGCVLPLVFLPACGGGGSSSGGAQNTPAAVSTPAVEISFPLPNSSLGGRSTVTVSGKVVDTTDNSLSADDIAEFLVNGLRPVLNRTTERWSVELPVTGDTLEISALVTSQSGHEAAASLSVINPPVAQNFDFILPDPTGNLLYLYGSGALRVLDRAAGTERLLNDQLLELGMDYRIPIAGLRMDSPKGEAYVVRNGIPPDAVAVQLDDGASSTPWSLPAASSSARFRNDFRYPDFAVDTVGNKLVFSYISRHAFSPVDYCRLLTVDMTSGMRNDLHASRSVFESVGGPESALCPDNVLVDRARNRVLVSAFVIDTGLAPQSDYFGVYAFDLQSGEQSTVADAAIGTGPLLSTPERLFASSDPDRILVLDDARLLAVNLINGNRTLLLDTIEIPDDTSDIAFDEAANVLLFASAGRTISALDVGSGEWQTLREFSRAVGTGPGDFSFDSLPVLDSVGQRLLIFPRYKNSLIAIDLHTLERSVLTADVTGSGEQQSRVLAAVVSQSGSHVYYFEVNSKQLTRINLATAELEVISSPTRGSGPELRHINGISVDEEQEMIYLTGTYDNLVSGALAVDIPSGNRRILSARAQETHPFETLDQHLFDAAQSRLLSLTSDGRLLGIDLTSGVREVLLDDSENTHSHRGIAWDSDGRGILILGEDGPVANGVALQAVDLDSGQRELVGTGLRNFAFDAQRNAIYAIQIYGQRSGQVSVIDRDSGESALIARED